MVRSLHRDDAGARAGSRLSGGIIVTEEVIAALERECAQAFVSVDGDALDRFLAADFTCVTSVEGPQFRIEEREAWIKRLRNSNSVLRIDDVCVAMHGGVAVATVLATEAAGEVERTIERVFADIWITAEGGWRLVERHESQPIQQ
jgi:hypothetical protein